MAIKNITQLGIFLCSMFFLVYSACAENNPKNSSNPVQSSKQSPVSPIKDALIATENGNSEHLSIQDIDDRQEGLSSALMIGPMKRSLTNVCILDLSNNSDNPQPITDIQQIRKFVGQDGRLGSNADGRSLLLVHINLTGAFCFNALEKRMLVAFNPDESVVFYRRSGLKLYIFSNNTHHKA